MAECHKVGSTIPYTRWIDQNDGSRTGHPRLMMAVRKMGLRTGKGARKDNLIIECQVSRRPFTADRERFIHYCPFRAQIQGSSLGHFTTQWMNEFHWSARGESAEDWLDEPKKRREKLPYPPVKVIFPTKKTVQDSALGEPVSNDMSPLTTYINPCNLVSLLLN